MDCIFERKINYYETDKMGVVHHSNYIRFLEEARCYYMEQLGIPYSKFEENGFMIPVLNVNCTYKHPVTFDDTLLIKVFVKKLNIVKMTIGYEVTDKATGNTVIECETSHCFTDVNLKPINLKKAFPEAYEKLQEKE